MLTTCFATSRVIRSRVDQEWTWFVNVCIILFSVFFKQLKISVTSDINLFCICSTARFQMETSKSEPNHKGFRTKTQLRKPSWTVGKLFTSAKNDPSDKIWKYNLQLTIMKIVLLNTWIVRIHFQIGNCTN